MKRGIWWLLGLSALGALALGTWRLAPAPPPLPLPSGPSQAPVAAPGTPTGLPPPADPRGLLPYKAIDGTIYTDKLFWGCIRLETSPFPTNPAQANEVLRVIGLLEAKLRKNAFYDQELLANLRPEQITFTEARVASLSADGMHANFHPDHIHGVVSQLEAISGQSRPADPVSVPDNIVVPDRPLTVSRMTSFMIAWDGLQADPNLRIEAKQAAILLPFVDSYVRLKSMKQQTKTDILAVLSDEQKRWIDANPARDEEISDMTQLTTQLKALMTEKARD